MLDTFVFETTELLESLDEILMRTEQDSLLADDIGEIFRIMHTIKGSASMMGLQNMSKLAHSVEDLFYIIRENPDVQYDKPAMYELLFAGSDGLKNEIELLSDESAPLTDFTELIDRIHAFAEIMKGGESKTATAAASQEEIFPEDEAENIKTFHVRFEESCMMPAIRGMVLVNSLGECAEVCSTIPADLEPDEAGEQICANGLYIKAVCDSTEDVLKILKDGIDVKSAELLKRPPKDKEGTRTFLVKFDEGCLMPSIRAMVLVNSLGGCGEVCSTVPDDLEADSAGDVISAQGLKIKMLCDDGEAVLSQLRDGLNVLSAEEIVKDKKPPQPKQEVKPQPEPQKSEQPKPATPKKEASSAGTGSIISVRLEKLDRLLNLVAEIVITESGVTSSPDLKNVQGNMDRFSKSARELKKLTDELQDVVMSIRMVPVQTAFSKMSRVVRDMNKKLGKNVELVFEGADTEADKSVVDILGDPLMHIVRNAVDHGIETPEERAQAGKTEPARVVLSAGYESGEVVISCSDNGAGMDPKKLLAKAKKNGILTKPESEYTDEDCFNLIMAAGFSTNETITEYSGRGVGMDVVRKNIEKVGGKLIVQSEWGKGSTFTIRIPLSLSIIDVLGINAEGSNFSVPISSVLEIFKADESMIMHDPNGTELVMLRDKCLRVVRLSEVFELERKGDKHGLTDGIMLHCREGGMEAVIYGEELTADQQVVVKPFSPLLSAYNLKEKGLSGCSILADGSITLIADIERIFARCGIIPEQAEQGGR